MGLRRPQSSVINFAKSETVIRKLPNKAVSLTEGIIMATLTPDDISQIITEG